MTFYLVFSEHVYVIMFRLTITQSLCMIIIIVKQVPTSSKITVIFKKIIINVHPTFLNIYHFIINNDPVLSTAIRFRFFSETVGCSVEDLKKLLWSLSADRIYLHLTVAGATYDM